MRRSPSCLLHLYLVLHLSGAPQIASALQDTQQNSAPKSLDQWGSRKEHYKEFQQYLAQSPQKNQCLSKEGYISDEKICDQLYRQFLSQKQLNGAGSTAPAAYQSPKPLNPDAPKQREMPKNPQDAQQLLHKELENSGSGAGTSISPVRTGGMAGNTGSAQNTAIDENWNSYPKMDFSDQPDPDIPLHLSQGQNKEEFQIKLKQAYQRIHANLKLLEKQKSALTEASKNNPMEEIWRVEDIAKKGLGNTLENLSAALEVPEIAHEKAFFNEEIRHLRKAVASSEKNLQAWVNAKQNHQLLLALQSGDAGLIESVHNWLGRKPGARPGAEEIQKSASTVAETEVEIRNALEVLRVEAAMTRDMLALTVSAAGKTDDRKTVQEIREALKHSLERLPDKAGDKLRKDLEFIEQAVNNFEKNPSDGRSLRSAGERLSSIFDDLTDQAAEDPHALAALRTVHFYYQHVLEQYQAEADAALISEKTPPSAASSYGRIYSDPMLVAIASGLIEVPLLPEATPLYQWAKRRIHLAAEEEAAILAGFDFEKASRMDKSGKMREGLLIHFKGAEGENAGSVFNSGDGWLVETVPGTGIEAGFYAAEGVTERRAGGKTILTQKPIGDGIEVIFKGYTVHISTRQKVFLETNENGEVMRAVAAEDVEKDSYRGVSKIITEHGVQTPYEAGFVLDDGKTLQFIFNEPKGPIQLKDIPAHIISPEAKLKIEKFLAHGHDYFLQSALQKTNGAKLLSMSYHDGVLDIIVESPNKKEDQIYFYKDILNKDAYSKSEKKKYEQELKALMAEPDMVQQRYVLDLNETLPGWNGPKGYLKDSPDAVYHPLHISHLNLARADQRYGYSAKGNTRIKYISDAAWKENGSPNVFKPTAKEYLSSSGSWAELDRIGYQGAPLLSRSDRAALNRMNALGHVVEYAFSPFQSAAYAIAAGGAWLGNSGLDAKIQKHYTLCQAKFVEWASGENPSMACYMGLKNSLSSEEWRQFKDFIDHAEDARHEIYGVKPWRMKQYKDKYEKMKKESPELFRTMTRLGVVKEDLEAQIAHPVSDEERAERAAVMFGFRNTPGYYIAAGRHDWAKGERWKGGALIAAGGGIIAAEMYAEGAGFGTAMAPLKSAAALARYNKAVAFARFGRANVTKVFEKQKQLAALLEKSQKGAALTAEESKFLSAGLTAQESKIAAYGVQYKDIAGALKKGERISEISGRMKKAEKAGKTLRLTDEEARIMKEGLNAQEQAWISFVQKAGKAEGYGLLASISPSLVDITAKTTRAYLEGDPDRGDIFFKEFLPTAAAFGAGAVGWFAAQPKIAVAKWARQKGQAKRPAPQALDNINSMTTGKRVAEMKIQETQKTLAELRQERKDAAVEKAKAQEELKKIENEIKKNTEHKQEIEKKAEKILSLEKPKEDTRRRTLQIEDGIKKLESEKQAAQERANAADQKLKEISKKVQDTHIERAELNKRLENTEAAPPEKFQDSAHAEAYARNKALFMDQLVKNVISKDAALSAELGRLYNIPEGVRVEVKFKKRPETMDTGVEAAYKPEIKTDAAGKKYAEIELYYDSNLGGLLNIRGTELGSKLAHERGHASRHQKDGKIERTFEEEVRAAREEVLVYRAIKKALQERKLNWDLTRNEAGGEPRHSEAFPLQEMKALENAYAKGPEAFKDYIRKLYEGREGYRSEAAPGPVKTDSAQPILAAKKAPDAGQKAWDAVKPYLESLEIKNMAEMERVVRETAVTLNKTGQWNIDAFIKAMEKRGLSLEGPGSRANHKILSLMTSKIFNEARAGTAKPEPVAAEIPKSATLKNPELTAVEASKLPEAEFKQWLEKRQGTLLNPGEKNPNHGYLPQDAAALKQTVEAHIARGDIRAARETLKKAKLLEEKIPNEPAMSESNKTANADLQKTVNNLTASLKILETIENSHLAKEFDQAYMEFIRNPSNRGRFDYDPRHEFYLDRLIRVLNKNLRDNKKLSPAESALRDTVLDAVVAKARAGDSPAQLLLKKSGIDWWAKNADGKITIRSDGTGPAVGDKITEKIESEINRLPGEEIPLDKAPAGLKVGDEFVLRVFSQKSGNRRAEIEVGKVVEPAKPMETTPKTVPPEAKPVPPPAGPRTAKGVLELETKIEAKAKELGFENAKKAEEALAERIMEGETLPAEDAGLWTMMEAKHRGESRLPKDQALILKEQRAKIELERNIKEAPERLSKEQLKEAINNEIAAKNLPDNLAGNLKRKDNKSAWRHVKDNYLADKADLVKALKKLQNQKALPKELVKPPVDHSGPRREIEQKLKKDRVEIDEILIDGRPASKNKADRWQFKDNNQLIEEAKVRAELEKIAEREHMLHSNMRQAVEDSKLASQALNGSVDYFGKSRTPTEVKKNALRELVREFNAKPGKQKMEISEKDGTVEISYTEKGKKHIYTFAEKNGGFEISSHSGAKDLRYFDPVQGHWVEPAEWRAIQQRAAELAPQRAPPKTEPIFEKLKIVGKAVRARIAKPAVKKPSPQTVKQLKEAEAKLAELKADNARIEQIKKDSKAPEKSLERLENELIRILESRLKQMDALDSVRLGRQALKQKAITRKNYVEALEAQFTEILKSRLLEAGVDAKKIRAIEKEAAGDAKKTLQGLEKLLADRLREVLKEKKITEDVDMILTHEGAGWAYKRLKELLGIKRPGTARRSLSKAEAELKAEVRQELVRAQELRAREAAGEIPLETIVHRIFEKARQEKGRDLSPLEKAGLRDHIFEQLGEKPAGEAPPPQPRSEAPAAAKPEPAPVKLPEPKPAPKPEPAAKEPSKPSSLASEAEVKAWAEKLAKEAEQLGLEVGDFGFEKSPDARRPHRLKEGLDGFEIIDALNEAISARAALSKEIVSSELNRSHKTEGDYQGPAAEHNAWRWPLNIGRLFGLQRRGQQPKVQRIERMLNDPAARAPFLAKIQKAASPLPFTDALLVKNLRMILEDIKMVSHKQKRVMKEGLPWYKRAGPMGYMAEGWLNHPLMTLGTLGFNQAVRLALAPIKKGYWMWRQKSLRARLDPASKAFEMDLVRRRFGSGGKKLGEQYHQIEKGLKEINEILGELELEAAAPPGRIKRGLRKIPFLGRKFRNRFDKYHERLNSQIRASGTKVGEAELLGMLKQRKMELELAKKALDPLGIKAVKSANWMRRFLFGGAGLLAALGLYPSLRNESGSEMAGGPGGLGELGLNGLNAPAEADPGEVIRVKVKVANAGSAATGKPFLVRMALNPQHQALQEWIQRLKPQSVSAAPVMDAVDAQGGRIGNPRKGLPALNVLPNSLAAPVEITINAVPEEEQAALIRKALEAGMLMVGTPFEFGPEGTKFDGEMGAHAEFPYDPGNLPPFTDDKNLQVYHWNPAAGSWEKVPSQFIKRGVIAAHLRHFSIYAILADSSQAIRPELLKDVVRQNALAENEELTLEETVQIPFNAQPGPYFMEAQIESDEKISEQNKIARGVIQIRKKQTVEPANLDGNETPELAKAANPSRENPSQPYGGGGGGSGKKPEQGEYGGDPDFDGSGNGGGGGGGGGAGDGSNEEGEQAPGYEAQEAPPSFAANEENAPGSSNNPTAKAPAGAAAPENAASNGGSSPDRSGSGAERESGEGAEPAGLAPRRSLAAGEDGAGGGGGTRLGRAIPMLMPYSRGRRSAARPAERPAPPAQRAEVPDEKLPELAQRQAETPAGQIFLPDPEQGPLFGGFIWPQAPSSIDDLLLFFFLVIFLSFMIARLMKRYA